MKADILTLKALFQKDVRYVIPTFQRPVGLSDSSTSCFATKECLRYEGRL